MITLLVHINNAEPVKIDVEEMPNLNDTLIIGKNPRDRAEKDVPWIEDGVTTVMFPLWRITFLEILPSPEDEVEFPLPFRSD